MLKLFLQIVGWTLAHLPERLLHMFCAGLGRTMLWLSPRRRRLVFSNLNHAFPDRPGDWHRRIARESSRRLFETALLSLAGPFLAADRVNRMISVDPKVLDYFESHHRDPFPIVVSTPHMAYWESLTWLGLFLRNPLPEFGVIFRPLDNAAADAWVKQTRERYGMKLLSRKTGLQESFKILKRNGVVGVLFDQNAGMQGALTTLLGRVCSTTELPGMLAERTGARVVAYYARRTGFWRIHFELAEVAAGSSASDVTLRLNRWLENALRGDDNLCASWLWSHDRWRNQDIPERRFRLEAKRDLLDEELRFRGDVALPRKTRIWIRMPNWLGDVVMSLPLLRALRLSRPDAEITLIGKAAFLPLLSAAGCADKLRALPSRGRGYFAEFFRWRKDYPDTYVLFTHSTRSDLEARLTGCRQRFGVVRHRKSRRLLSHAFVVPADFQEAQHHQLELWTRFFRHFGLAVDPDLAPLTLPSPAETDSSPLSEFAAFAVVGLIAGSENTPEKRWPVEHWRTLIATTAASNPRARFALFGTANDQPITSAIASGFDGIVLNLAGKTNLVTYMYALKRCRALVSNDTGGMHLANALGVPIIGLFGPTNPIRTGPVFSSPRILLQPPGCAPSGGGSLASLSPDTVAEALRPLLAEDSIPV